MSQNSSNNHRYLGFSLGEEQFGIPLLTVREVIGVPEITAIPQSPKHFLGIMNLRGQVISIIDLRQKLGITPRKDAETAVVICDIGGSHLGIVVDSVDQVYSPSPDEVSEKPEIEKTKGSQYITSVYRNDKRLVLFLDIARTLDMDDQNAIKRSNNAPTKAA